MRNKILLTVIAILVIIIMALFLPNMYKARFGKNTVTLTTIPIHAADLINGHYAVINYQISSFILSDEFQYDEGDEFSPRDIKNNKIKKGDTVYIELEEKNGYSHAVNLFKTPRLDKVLIKGTLLEIIKPHKESITEIVRLETAFEKKQISQEEYIKKTNERYNWHFKVKYGIEKVFVSEKKAKQMDFTKPLRVKVMLDSNGNPSVDSIEKAK